MEIEHTHEKALPIETDPLETVSDTATVSLAILAERLEQLTDLFERTADENTSLRERNQQLQVECDLLREKYQQSRTRIEAMIVRLKNLEQPS